MPQTELSSSSESTSSDDVISPSTARRLASYGITFISSADQIILKRDSTVVAKIAKTGGRFLGPGISLLDAQAAEGLLRAQTRININRYYEDTGDLSGMVTMQQMLSQNDHVGVVIFLAAHGRGYRSYSELLNETRGR